MDLASWGIVAVLVVGTAVIAYGWLSDRRATRERRAAIETPPDDGPAPVYVSAEQAGRDRAPRVLSDADLKRLPQRLAAAPTVDTGRPGEDFVTDPPWTVVLRPVVLVCADDLSSMRDLVGVIGRLEAPRPNSDAGRRPLVVVAAEFDDALLRTLAANFTQQKLIALPIRADSAQRARVCELTGATAVSQADLHAGYAPADALGACATWICDARSSWIESDNSQPDVASSGTRLK